MMTSSAVTIPSIGIWNDEKNAHIGTLELGKQVSVVKKTYENYQHVGSQTSSFNYASKQLSFVGLNTTTNEKFIITVDTTTWKELNNSLLNASNTYTGLAYDNSTDEYNLFATFTSNSDSIVHVGKIFANDHKLKKLHEFSGVVSTTVFNPKTKIYYIIYTKSIGSTELFVNSYDIDCKPLEIAVEYKVTNVGQSYKTVGTPYNIGFVEKSETIICNINVESATNKGGPELFWFNPSTKEFKNSGWNGHQNLAIQFKHAYAIFSDPSLPRIYQMAQVHDNSFKLYTYSTYNNSWTDTKKVSVAATSIFPLKK